MGFFANIIADSKGGVSHTDSIIKSSSIDLLSMSSDTQLFDSSSPNDASSFHDNPKSHTKAAPILENTQQATETFSKIATNISSDTSINVNGGGQQQAQRTIDIATRQHQHEPSVQTLKHSVEKNPNDTQQPTSDKNTTLNKTSSIETTPEPKFASNIEIETGDADRSTINHAIKTGFLHKIVDTLSQHSHNYDYQSDKVFAPVESKPTNARQSELNIELSPNDDKKFVNQEQQSPQPQASHYSETDAKLHSLQANIAANLSQPTQPVAEQQQVKQPQVHIGQLDIIVQAPQVNNAKSQPAVTITSASRQYLRSL